MVLHEEGVIYLIYAAYLGLIFLCMLEDASLVRFPFSCGQVLGELLSLQLGVVGFVLVIGGPEVPHELLQSSCLQHSQSLLSDFGECGLLVSRWLEVDDHIEHEV